MRLYEERQGDACCRIYVHTCVCVCVGLFDFSPVFTRSMWLRNFSVHWDATQRRLIYSMEKFWGMLGSLTRTHRCSLCLLRFCDKVSTGRRRILSTDNYSKSRMCVWTNDTHAGHTPTHTDSPSLSCSWNFNLNLVAHLLGILVRQAAYEWKFIALAIFDGKRCWMLMRAEYRQI